MFFGCLFVVAGAGGAAALLAGLSTQQHTILFWLRFVFIWQVLWIVAVVNFVSGLCICTMMLMCSYSAFLYYLERCLWFVGYAMHEHLSATCKAFCATLEN